jgi:hypothetical protein
MPSEIVNVASVPQRSPFRYPGGKTWLVKKITTFDLTTESADDELSRVNTTLEDKAFQTILKNRINRGGILAPGAGRVKNGENGIRISITSGSFRWRKTWPENLS